MPQSKTKHIAVEGRCLQEDLVTNMKIQGREVKTGQMTRMPVK